MLNKFFHRVFSLKMQSDESLISQDTTHRAEHLSQEFERYIRMAAPGQCHLAHFITPWPSLMASTRGHGTLTSPVRPVSTGCPKKSQEFLCSLDIIGRLLISVNISLYCAALAKAYNGK